MSRKLKVYYCYQLSRCLILSVLTTVFYYLLLRLYLYCVYCVRQYECEYVLTTVFYYLLLRLFLYCTYCVSTYVTMSTSTGFYPKLDLWKGNKLHYIYPTLLCMRHGLYLFQKLLNQTNIHGHQGDKNHADNRGYQEDRTRGHSTSPQRYPPYHTVNGTHSGHTTCSTQLAVYRVHSFIKYQSNTLWMLRSHH